MQNDISSVCNLFLYSEFILLASNTILNIYLYYFSSFKICFSVVWNFCLITLVGMQLGSNTDFDCELLVLSKSVGIQCISFSLTALADIMEACILKILYKWNIYSVIILICLFSFLRVTYLDTNQKSIILFYAILRFIVFIPTGIRWLISHSYRHNEPTFVFYCTLVHMMIQYIVFLIECLWYTSDIKFEVVSMVLRIFTVIIIFLYVLVTARLERVRAVYVELGDSSNVLSECPQPQSIDRETEFDDWTRRLSKDFVEVYDKFKVLPLHDVYATRFLKMSSDLCVLLFEHKTIHLANIRFLCCNVSFISKYGWSCHYSLMELWITLCILNEDETLATYASSKQELQNATGDLEKLMLRFLTTKEQQVADLAAIGMNTDSFLKKHHVVISDIHRHILNTNIYFLENWNPAIFPAISTVLRYCSYVDVHAQQYKVEIVDLEVLFTQEYQRDCSLRCYKELILIALFFRMIQPLYRSMHYTSQVVDKIYPNNTTINVHRFLSNIGVTIDNLFNCGKIFLPPKTIASTSRNFGGVGAACFTVNEDISVLLDTAQLHKYLQSLNLVLVYNTFQHVVKCRFQQYENTNKKHVRSTKALLVESTSENTCTQVAESKISVCDTLLVKLQEIVKPVLPIDCLRITSQKTSLDEMTNTLCIKQNAEYDHDSKITGAENRATANSTTDIITNTSQFQAFRDMKAIQKCVVDSQSVTTTNRKSLILLSGNASSIAEFHNVETLTEDLLHLTYWFFKTQRQAQYNWLLPTLQYSPQLAPSKATALCVRFHLLLQAVLHTALVIDERKLHIKMRPTLIQLVSGTVALLKIAFVAAQCKQQSGGKDITSILWTMTIESKPRLRRWVVILRRFWQVYEDINTLQHDTKFSTKSLRELRKELIPFKFLLIGVYKQNKYITTETKAMIKNIYHCNLDPRQNDFVEEHVRFDRTTNDLQTLMFYIKDVSFVLHTLFFSNYVTTLSCTISTLCEFLLKECIIQSQYPIPIKYLSSISTILNRLLLVCKLQHESDLPWNYLCQIYKSYIFDNTEIVNTLKMRILQFQNKSTHE